MMNTKQSIRKAALTLIAFQFSLLTSLAQGWPSQYGGVMLQAFYWDSFDDSHWVVLEQQTDQLKGTFDLVWLPQSGNCGSGTSMGYDDMWWFNNYNSSFGNEQQLRSLISTFKANGIKTIADVVINHRKEQSNWVVFPKETYKGVTYEMKSTDVVANDDGGKTRTWATQNGYSLSSNNDSGEDWSGMRDLDHKSQNVQTIVKAYLGFLKNDLGYAGFRYDMVKGYSASFTGQYNVASQPEFSVGECWDGTNTIKNWIEGTKVNGAVQSAAFDFQFRYTVRNAMNNSNYSRLAQQNDGNWPLVSKDYQQGAYRRYAVTFVENHDTEKRSNAAQDPLKRDTLAANAYLLAMPGTPCVFLTHWKAYPAEIKAMVAARKQAGVTNVSSYFNFRSTSSYYANVVSGANGDNSLLVVVGNVSANETNVNKQQWAKALEGYHYAYYLPASLNTAYADMPSGTYEGVLRVRLSAVKASADGSQLVYTTDGSEPNAQSAKVVSGSTITIPVGTTTLRVAMLNGSTVSGSITRQYTVKKKSSSDDVTIPSFCTVNDGEVCAFFESPLTWGNVVHCWAWSNTPSDNFTWGETHGWPGASCTLLGTADNGNKVWKWTWDGVKEKNSAATQPAFIIFNNNGSPQTPDLAFTNAGYYTKDRLIGTVSSGISAPQMTDSDDHTVYDLSGRRIGDTKPLLKGIYIIGHRKVIVK